MRLLYLSQRLPYPPDRGDRIATFHHIRCLSRRHHVYVAALVASDAEARKAPRLLEWAAEVCAEKQSRLASWKGMLSSLARREPLTLGHFWNPRLQAAVDRTIARNRIEAAIAFSSSMAQYLVAHRGLRRVMHFCDVDSQKWADLSERSRGPKRWIYRREARLLLDYERQVAGEFEASCVVTEGEAALFRRLIPDVSIDVVENGVDLDYFQSTPRLAQSEDLIFVGVMDYPPNEEAVVWFVRNAWPSVLTRAPSAHFYIVGARPTATVRALGGRPGVTVTGYVDDVRPYMSRSSLAVIPLAVARGIQNKVLEAMAAGLPTLVTPILAASLPPEAADVIHVAERRADVFARKVLNILQDRETADIRARRGIALVREHYLWERTVEGLEQLMEDTKGHARCVG